MLPPEDFLSPSMLGLRLEMPGWAMEAGAAWAASSSASSGYSSSSYSGGGGFMKKNSRGVTTGMRMEMPQTRAGLCWR